MIDPTGFYGEAVHYSIVIFFVGTAFMTFLYLWKKGRLDMDEEPKLQMMESEDSHERRR